MVTVQIQNGQLQLVISAINELLTKPVNVRTAMRIRSIARVLGEQAADVEAERKRLIETHMLRGEDGEPIYLDEERTQVKVTPAFSVDYADLMDLTFACGTLLASELEKLESVTAGLLMRLGDVLVDDLAA